MKNNKDSKTVIDFGREWGRFNQEFASEQLIDIYKAYFSIFPFEMINKNSQGFDMGCGSGRWAKYMAPKVGKLYCIDPSLEALNVAKKNLSSFNNCVFERTTADSFSVPSCSLDFGYSLGVLHHVPNTQSALNKCVEKLKPGSPFLLYLYYNFDNRGDLFFTIWKLSDFFRKIISKSPFFLKTFICDVLAFFIYLPFARASLFFSSLGYSVRNIPLSYYRDKSFYVMRTDSLDRFGTRLEKRFSRKEIESIMLKSGLTRIKFSEEEPFWTAVGIKKSEEN